MQNISFCLLFTNKNSANMVANLLLNLGYLPYLALDFTEAYEILSKKEINFLFIDLDFFENSSFQFLKKIKEEEKFSSLFVIATSNTDFINKIKEYNIILFIPKPLQPDVVKEKIVFLIEKLKDNFKRRKHIRIVPSEDEFMQINFKLSNEKYLCGKVINISMGGLAALLYNNYESPYLKAGKVIEHIIFQADYKEIDVDAKIINKKEKLITFQFTHFYNDSYSRLLDYISKRIASL